MTDLPTPDNQEVEAAIAEYGDMVYRILRLHLHEKADVEDMYQEVFIRYMKNRRPFKDENHRKAWLCRVAINLTKDFQRSFWRKRVVSMDQATDLMWQDSEEQSVVQAVQALPPIMKTVVHLHYYEGYSAVELSKLLGRNLNSIYSDLSRARKKMKNLLGDDETDTE